MISKMLEVRFYLTMHNVKIVKSHNQENGT